jgi:hypothetical protein
MGFQKMQNSGRPAEMGFQLIFADNLMMLWSRKGNPLIYGR